MSEQTPAPKRRIHPHVDTFATVLAGAATFGFIAQLYTWFAP